MQREDSKGENSGFLQNESRLTRQGRKTDFGGELGETPW